MAKKIKQDTIGFVTMQNYWATNIDERIKRLQEEAENLGYKTKILFYNKFIISFGNKKFNIFYDEKKLQLNKFKAFIPIINTHKNLDADTLFIYTLQKMDCRVINKLESILKAKNKGRSSLILASAGLPVIPSVITFSETGLKPLFDSIKDDEFICKLNYGSMGRGVSYIKSKISLISTLELLKAEDIQPSRVVFQKFIKESGGKDIRVIVVGKKIVAAMQRTSPSKDFRANLFSGGTGKKINISDKIREVSIKAVSALKLDYGGVDIIMSKSGPLIAEVNPNPGLEIENITNKNIAKEIIKYVIKNK